MQDLKEKAEANPAQLLAHIVRESVGYRAPYCTQSGSRERISEKQFNVSAEKIYQETRHPWKRYQQTLAGEPFLLMGNQNAVDEDKERVLVFATGKNIKMPCRSPLWFVDGAFKISPTIRPSSLRFTIIRLRRCNYTLRENTLPPFVCALLEEKPENEYAKVLRTVKDPLPAKVYTRVFH